MGFKWIILLICNIYAVSRYEFALRPVRNQNEGYVEMRVDGTWGIMSALNAKLDEFTARILCESFGFGWTGFSTISLVTLQLSNKVLYWHNIIQCNGSESNATECVRGNWTNTDERLSTLPRGWTKLHCFDYNVTDIRLYGGVLPHEGRLEVKVDNRWGAICNNFYDANVNIDAVCSLLGYANDSAPFTSSNIADNIEPVEVFWMQSLSCANTDGTANNINQCEYKEGFDRTDCLGTFYVVTLKCEPAKIVNSTTPNSGIIEVGLFGKLQMVCGSSSFSTKEANVTCNALGYRSVGRVSAVKISVDNTWDVFNGSIQCDGTEQSLEMCDIVQEHSACHDSTVKYIECLGGPIDIIPIGNKSNEGIFTMFNWNKLWVVGDGAFSNTTAKTLCYLLGHGYEGSSQYLATLPVNVSLTEYTSLEELECHGNESDIAQCRRRFFYPCKRCPIGPPGGFALLKCAECPPGKFGTHCTGCNCNNRSTGPCDTETGECTCQDGWSGTSCELDIDECVTPTVCTNISDCTNVPGSYQCVCRPGYTLTDGICDVSPNKEETEPKSNLLVIILSSVIGGLALVSVIAIFCICKYRMKGKKNTSHSVDATTTCRSGQELTLSSIDKCEEYSTIDDRFVHESRIDPYNIIDVVSTPTSDRIANNNVKPDIRGRPGHHQMHMNNKDARQMSDKKDYDYPYPSVLPTDDDGYLKIGKAGDIHTDERKYSPYINANATYQPLNPANRSEHDYDQMKL